MKNSSATVSEQLEKAKMLLKAGSPREQLQKIVAHLKDANTGWDWVGIYLLYEDTLKLGPYVGDPTEHTEIQTGHGVCGSAVKENANQIIDDVNQLDNYIACSTGTQSEIVVLIKDGKEILGQFDIDSDDKAAFTKRDEELLEEMAKLVIPAVRAYMKSNKD